MPAPSRRHPAATALTGFLRLPFRRIVLHTVLALLALPASRHAGAQTSGSIALVSEHSLRGLSLSGRRPAMQLRIEHDAAAGWYGGGFLSTVELPGSKARGQLVAYAGHARRFASGASWELGASQAVFPGERRYDYFEAYAGLSFDRAGTRLYLSPSYYGAGKTAYLELNAFHPLGERLRLVARAGLLHRIGEHGNSRRNRADLRLGLDADVGDCTLQLAWLARQRDPVARARHARALAASASYAF